MREREGMTWSVMAVSDRLRWRRFVSTEMPCRPLHARFPISAEQDCVQHALNVGGRDSTLVTPESLLLCTPVPPRVG